MAGSNPGQILGWPDPAQTKQIALLAEKLVKNRPKSAARTGPWPKKASPNQTFAKKGQPEPDPGQKKVARPSPRVRHEEIAGEPEPLLNVFHL